MNALTPINNTPTPVVFEKDGEIYASSRDVAEYFGKLHTHVLQAIEGLHMSATFRETNFRLSNYTVPTNRRMYKAYNMTKDGFTRVVMAFNGKKAGKFIEAYIQRFNDMEAALKATQPESFDAHLPTTFAEALRMAADQQERIEVLRERNDKLKLDKQVLLIHADALEEKAEVTEAKLDVAHGTIGKCTHQLTKFVRTMEGVNSMKVQGTLRELGYLKAD